MDNLELRASRSNVCKVVEDMYICHFPLRALTPKISSRGGGIANAKPKYPPDASGGYNNHLDNNMIITLQRDLLPPNPLLIKAHV